MATSDDQTPESEEQAAAEEADYSDVACALNEHTNELMERIPVDRVELSQPIDGKGARILASVPAGDGERMPRALDIRLGDRLVRVPLEISEDYSEVRAFGRVGSLAEEE